MTAALAALLFALGAGAGIAAPPPPLYPVGASSQTIDLLIYDPTGRRLLGQASYTLTAHGDLLLIEGRNTFLDGQHDAEHETLDAAIHGATPRLVSYEHSFFDASGAKLIVARADALSGRTYCERYQDGHGAIDTATIQFPSDTYAGASVLVPIADRLKSGPASNVDIHVFDCASGPRILNLRVNLARATWRYKPHGGELIKADARPVFGWFDIFLKPFVPTTRMWFDPSSDFAFVGAILSRYYRGPEVLLVKKAPPVKAAPVFERPPPTVLSAVPPPAPLMPSADDNLKSSAAAPTSPPQVATDDSGSPGPPPPKTAARSSAAAPGTDPLASGAATPSPTPAAR